jgi:hypothetical protein
MNVAGRMRFGRTIAFLLALVLIAVCATSDQHCTDEYDSESSVLALFDAPVMLDGTTSIDFPCWVPVNATGFSVSFWLWIDSETTKPNHWVSVLHRVRHETSTVVFRRFVCVQSRGSHRFDDRALVNSIVLLLSFYHPRPLQQVFTHRLAQHRTTTNQSMRHPQVH